MTRSLNPYDALIASVRDTCQAHNLLQNNNVSSGPVVAAVSGGPDSVALLLALRDVMRNQSQAGGTDTSERDTPAVVVVHVHHGLRGHDADHDATFVHELGARLGLPVHIERCDVSGHAAQFGMSIEHAARQLRYDTLARIARTHGSQIVAAGHHADDQAETIFANIIRGTGLRGLRGMAYRSRVPGNRDIRLIRPLLDVRRMQIIAALDAAGQSYCHDASNDQTTYQRNYIRHNILPSAEVLNPQAVRQLCRLGQHSRQVYRSIRRQARRALAGRMLDASEHRVVLDRTAAAGLSEAVRGEMIRLILTRMGCPLRDITHDWMQTLAGMLTQASMRACTIPGGVQVVADRGHVTFDSGGPVQPAIAVPVPGRVELCGKVGVLQAEKGEFDQARFGALVQQKRHGSLSTTEWLDADAIAGDLIVRTVTNGDRMQPFGGPTDKSLMRIASESGVDTMTRRRQLVVCDRRGPIWLVGCRPAQRVACTPVTRSVVMLSYRKYP